MKNVMLFALMLASSPALAELPAECLNPDWTGTGRLAPDRILTSELIRRCLTTVDLKEEQKP